jgi:LacI family transcriptional regulator
MPLFGEFVGRIEVEARMRDHLTMIGNTGYDPERELEFATAFAEVGIDGLVVIGAANAPETAKLCRQERIPVVWMHNIRGDVGAKIVGVDHVRAGALITRHLVDEHDSTDIAFVGSFTAADVRHGDRETVQQRFAGLTSVIGGGVPLIRTDLTPAGAYAGVSAFLRNSDRLPQAVVIGTYGQASATIRAIIDAGLDIPNDIRVVGFDGGSHDYGQFRLTTAQQPVDTIAHHALSQLLDDPTARSLETTPPDLTESSLQIGETCGCPPTGLLVSSAP